MTPITNVPDVIPAVHGGLHALELTLLQERLNELRQTTENSIFLPIKVTTTEVIFEGKTPLRGERIYVRPCQAADGKRLPGITLFHRREGKDLLRVADETIFNDHDIDQIETTDDLQLLSSAWLNAVEKSSAEISVPIVDQIERYVAATMANTNFEMDLNLDIVLPNSSSKPDFLFFPSGTPVAQPIRLDYRDFREELIRNFAARMPKIVRMSATDYGHLHLTSETITRKTITSLVAIEAMRAMADPIYADLSFEFDRKVNP